MKQFTLFLLLVLVAGLLFSGCDFIDNVTGAGKDKSKYSEVPDGYKKPKDVALEDITDFKTLKDGEQVIKKGNQEMYVYTKSDMKAKKKLPEQITGAGEIDVKLKPGEVPPEDFIYNGAQEPEQCYFKITSTTPILEINPFEDSKEWWYNGTGWHNETVESNCMLEVKGDEVCFAEERKLSWSIGGIEQDCINYPPQLKEQLVLTMDADEIGFSWRLQERNIRIINQVGEQKVITSFFNEYDPTITTTFSATACTSDECSQTYRYNNTGIALDFEYPAGATARFRFNKDSSTLDETEQSYEANTNLADYVSAGGIDYSGGFDFETSNSDYISVNVSSKDILNNTGDWSVGVWVNVEQYYADGNTRRAYTFHYGTPGTGHRVTFYNSPTGRIGSNGRDADANIITILDVNGYSVDTWYHILSTYEVGVGYKGYIDGSHLGTSGEDAAAFSSYPLIIGAYASTGEWMDGEIDDLVIWNGTTLSQSDATSIANQERYLEGNYTQNFTFANTNNRANLDFNCTSLEANVECWGMVSGNDTWFETGSTGIILSSGTNRNVTIKLNTTNSSKTPILNNITLTTSLSGTPSCTKTGSSFTCLGAIDDATDLASITNVTTYNSRWVPNTTGYNPVFYMPFDESLESMGWGGITGASASSGISFINSTTLCKNSPCINDSTKYDHINYSDDSDYHFVTDRVNYSMMVFFTRIESGDYQRVMQIYEGGDTLGTMWPIGNTGRLQMYERDGGNDRDSLDTPDTYGWDNPGHFYTVAKVMDAQSGDFYIDGTDVSQTAATTDWGFPTNRVGLIVGNRHDLSTQYALSGTIDEFAAFRYLLSKTEMADINESGIMDHEGIIAYDSYTATGNSLNITALNIGGTGGSFYYRIDRSTDDSSWTNGTWANTTQNNYIDGVSFSYLRLNLMFNKTSWEYPTFTNITFVAYTAAVVGDSCDFSSTCGPVDCSELCTISAQGVCTDSITLLFYNPGVTTINTFINVSNALFTDTCAISGSGGIV